jgi:hypothetical protein
MPQVTTEKQVAAESLTSIRGPDRVGPNVKKSAPLGQHHRPKSAFPLHLGHTAGVERLFRKPKYCN